MSDYYSPAGNPIDLETWVRVRKDFHRVAGDDVGPYWVSTVYLGLDHRFGLDDGPPLIYETMVFEPEAPLEGPNLFNRDLNFSDLDMDRYSTLEQAVAGHKAMVMRWYTYWIGHRALPAGQRALLPGDDTDPEGVGHSPGSASGREP